MADLMAWGVTIARGDYKWTAGGSNDWQTEVQRFFDELKTSKFLKDLYTEKVKL